MDLPTFIRSLAPGVPEAIERAAELFDERPGTVKAWLYRERVPRTIKAPKIIERSGRKVTYSGIYGEQERRA